MTKKIAVLSVLGALLVSSAWAGWNLEYKSSHEGGPRGGPGYPGGSDEENKPTPSTGIILLEKFKLKVKMGTGDTSWVIGDFDKQSFMVATKEDSSAGPSKGNSSKTPKQPTAVVGTVDEALTVLDQFMEQMAALIKGMADMMKNAPAEEPPKEQKAPKTTVKPLTGSKTIAGCATKGYQVLADDKPVSEVWACPDVDLDYLKPKLEALSKKMAEHSKKWLESMPKQATHGMPMNQLDMGKETDVLTQLKGFPFTIIEMDDSGKRTTTFEVTKYASKTIADSEFKLPAGYQTITIQDFLQKAMGGMMGGMGGMGGRGKGGGGN